jgi:hypothetical protein
MKKNFIKDTSEFFISEADNQESGQAEAGEKQPARNPGKKQPTRKPANKEAEKDDNLMVIWADKIQKLSKELPEGFKIVEETKSERTQLLLRPSMKKFIKEQAKKYDMSMNELIDKILMNYYSEIKAKEGKKK